LAEVASVVDLPAEFSRPAANVAWRALSMLDLVAPEPARLMEAVEAVDAARGQGPGLPDSNLCGRCVA
jgi:protein-tyrosine phosphatase